MSVLNLTCKLNEAGLNKQVQDLLTTVRFLAPTGAQGVVMSCVRACVRDIPQKNIENEF